MKIQCPCCNGTGELEVDARLSKSGTMRAELVRVWGVVKRLENLASSMHEVFAEAITELVGNLEGARSRIAAQNKQISSLKKEMGIYYRWNSRTSDNLDHYNAIKAFRNESQLHDSGVKPAADSAAATSKPAADEAASDNAGHVEARRQYRRREDAYENGTVPKNTGGQPGHKGITRNDKPTEATRIPVSLCKSCGTLPEKILKHVRTKGYDVDRRKGCTICVMYVYKVCECGVCGAECMPDAELKIPGTSFGPVLRGIIQSYHDAHVSEEDMRTLLADLENAHFSVGAISNCIKAMADHLNAPPICIPYEEPIVMPDNPLREYRSPIRPPHAWFLRI